MPDATFKALLESSIQREKPLLFYNWTPEWVHAAYDFTPIEEPARTEGCENVDLDAEDWLYASSFSCASRNAEIYVVYSLSLEQRNPPVAKFLSQLAMDPATVNGWIVEIGRDSRDPQDVAEEWVAENMDIVNEWIKQSAFRPKAFAVDPYQQQMQIPQRLHQAQAKCTDWRQNTAWVLNRDVVRDLAATGITSLHPV